MSETKFTPGPWFPHISFMGVFSVDVDKPAAVADMHLVRAAPELYKALEDARDAMLSFAELNRESEKAAAVLAKARGERK